MLTGFGGSFFFTASAGRNGMIFKFGRLGGNVGSSEFDTSVGFSFSKESDSKFWNCGSFISRVGIFGSGLNMIGTGGIFRTGKLKSGFSISGGSSVELIFAGIIDKVKPGTQQVEETLLRSGTHRSGFSDWCFDHFSNILCLFLRGIRVGSEEDREKVKRLFLIFHLATEGFLLSVLWN
uniref:Uncharacterized protein n=1 Tax=Anopheles merus TaxID=30066 RepID=A0A182UMJ5_ANOME